MRCASCPADVVPANLCNGLCPRCCYTEAVKAAAKVGKAL